MVYVVTSCFLYYSYIHFQSVKTYNNWTVHEYKCLFLTFVFLQIEREREWYTKFGYKGEMSPKLLILKGIWNPEGLFKAKIWEWYNTLIKFSVFHCISFNCIFYSCITICLLIAIYYLAFLTNTNNFYTVFLSKTDNLYTII